MLQRGNEKKNHSFRRLPEFIEKLRNFSTSPDKSYVATIHWIPAFAGMTGVYTQSSFRRKPESSDCYPDLLRSYEVTH